MYDRHQIMTAAWRNYRRFDITFVQALRLAWTQAKAAAARYNVYGLLIHDGSETLLASRVSMDEAGQVEWWHKNHYDRIERRVA